MAQCQSRSEIATFEKDNTAESVVHLLAKYNGTVVSEKYVYNSAENELTVFRKSFAKVYEHYDCQKGTKVPTHWRGNESYNLTFEVTPAGVVDHDGREWEDYARERFEHLMGKRFPNGGI